MAGKKSSNKKDVVDQETYCDCKLEVVVEGAEQKVYVDGKSVHVARDADAGVYYSRDAPYQAFGSMLEAARAVVDARSE